MQSACRLAGLSSHPPISYLWRGVQLRLRIIASHRGRNSRSDRVDGSAHRIGVKVGIACGRRGLRMAEQLVYDGKPERRASAEAGERMPEVVNANAL